MSRRWLLRFLVCMCIGGASVIIVAADRPDAKSKTWQRIRRQGFFTVSLDPDNLPYSARDGKLHGFEVELAEALAKRLDLKVKIDWIKARNETNLGKLLEGDCDMVMGLPMDPRLRNDDEPAAERIQYTKPYYRTGYLVFVRKKGPRLKSLKQLKGEQKRRVGVQAGTLADVSLKGRGFQHKRYGSQQAALKALVGGHIDFAYLWSNAVWLAREQKVEVMQSYDLEDGHNMAAAVRRGSEVFRARLNEALAQLVKEKFVKRLLSRYGLPYYPPSKKTSHNMKDPLLPSEGVTLVNSLAFDALPNRAWELQEEVKLKKKKLNPFAGDEQAITEGGELFGQFCAACHGQDGRGGKGPDLTDTRWLHGAEDKDLFRTMRRGVRGTTMKKMSILTSDDMIWKMIAFVRTLARTADDPGWKPYLSGDPIAGKKLFFDDKGKTNCAKCHTVDGDGGKVGPPLSRIAGQRSAKYLMESLVQPSADINPFYEGIEVVTKSGKVIAGIMVNEDNFSVQMRAQENARLLSFFRRDLEEVRKQKKSLMPADLAEHITVKQLHDLFAYVMTLDGLAHKEKKSSGK